MSAVIGVSRAVIGGAGGSSIYAKQVLSGDATELPELSISPALTPGDVLVCRFGYSLNGTGQVGICVNGDEVSANYDNSRYDYTPSGTNNVVGVAQSTNNAITSTAGAWAAVVHIEIALSPDGDLDVQAFVLEGLNQSSGSNKRHRRWHVWKYGTTFASLTSVKLKSSVADNIKSGSWALWNYYRN